MWIFLLNLLTDKDFQLIIEVKFQIVLKEERLMKKIGIESS